MRANLDKLIYLVSIKNDINRRRRRFYYYWNSPTTTWDDNKRQWVKPKPKHISREKAWEGYCKAKYAMKAMTKEITAIRQDIGVSLEWNDSGMIVAIILGEHRGARRIHYKDFKDYADMYMFDKLVLGA